MCAYSCVCSRGRAGHKAARSTHQHRYATRQAILTEELNFFKEITRAIIKHDANPEDAKLIHMEKRQILRRLAGLGVYGHQPAVNAFVQTDEHTDDTITTAIIQQKVGANTINAVSQYSGGTAILIMVLT